MFYPVWLMVLILGGMLLGEIASSIVLIAFLLSKVYIDVVVRKNWINPGFFLKVSLLITSTANLNTILVFNSGAHIYDYPYAHPEFFNEASLVWALGNLILIEANDRKAAIAFPSLKWNFTKASSLNWLFWASILITFRKLWLQLVLPGAFDSVLSLIPLLGILIHARLSEYYKSRFLFIKAIILMALVTGQAVLYSYLRMNMVVPGIVFFLGVLSSAKSFWVLAAPKFYPIYAFFSIFSIFFITFGTKRSELSLGLSRITELREVKSIELNSKRKQGLSAFERSANIVQLSAVSSLVDKNGYYLGKASKPLFTALIPRFLWPEKPKIALGVWFALEIGAALPTAEGWYNTSINMTIPGHLFLDFGWIGLLLGCYLCGRFIRILWETTKYQESPLNFTGSLFACFLLYSSFLGLGPDLQMFVTFLAVYLITLAIDRILNA